MSKSEYGLWRVQLDGKVYLLEYGLGFVELRPWATGKGKGSKEANTRMKALALALRGMHGTARANVKKFVYFVNPIREGHHDLVGRIPALCGGCGEDGPGCPACERTGEGRYRYEAIDVLGVVVRRLDVRGTFQIDEWANTLMLARVTVPFRSKDSNVVERECLLVEYGNKKTVYLPAHPTFQEEGMPRWRKQLSLVDDAPDEGPQDKAPRAPRMGQRPLRSGRARGR